MQSLDEANPRLLLDRLRHLLPSLGRVDRRIGEYILENPDRVLSASVIGMHCSCGVSAGSIVGFCRRLGLSGFTNLKLTLARELAQAGLPGWNREAREENPLRVLEWGFERHLAGLADTYRLNGDEAFQTASQALTNARRIEFFSVGMSYAVAYAACSALRLIGLAASIQADSHMQIAAATQLRIGDVAFGISCSGRSLVPVQCLEIARENKAMTLSVTNCMMSPITNCSDLILYATPSQVRSFQAPLAGHITQLAIIDALVVSITRRRKHKTKVLLQRVDESLAQHHPKAAGRRSSARTPSVR
ncbi:MAG: MurR/RpiR family transcriptional regulator [Acidobacteriota bacterium]